MFVGWAEHSTQPCGNSSDDGGLKKEMEGGGGAGSEGVAGVVDGDEIQPLDEPNNDNITLDEIIPDVDSNVDHSDAGGQSTSGVFP